MVEVGYWVCCGVWGQAEAGEVNQTGKEMEVRLHPGC